MFQGQADGVDGLDDAVVQVHADALALFQHRQAALLQVEAHVFDHRAHPGADRGEELHFQLVERLGLAGGHAQHAQHPAPPVQRQQDHLVEAVHHVLVQVRLVAGRLNHASGWPLLATRPTSPSPRRYSLRRHRLAHIAAAVQHQAQHVAVLLAQEDLADLEVQVIHHLGDGLVEDLVDIR